MRPHAPPSSPDSPPPPEPGSPARRPAPRAVGFAWIVALLVACAPSYTEDGRRMGEAHRTLIERSELTPERLVGDLEGAIADLEGAAREEFVEGYRESIEPVAPQIRAMLARAEARELEDLIGGTLQRMLRELADTADRMAEEAEGALEQVDPEKMREVGRNVGRRIHRVVEGVDAFVEGVREGVEGEPGAER